VLLPGLRPVTFPPLPHFLGFFGVKLTELGGRTSERFRPPISANFALITGYHQPWAQNANTARCIVVEGSTSRAASRLPASPGGLD